MVAGRRARGCKRGRDCAGRGIFRPGVRGAGGRCIRRGRREFQGLQSAVAQWRPRRFPRGADRRLCGVADRCVGGGTAWRYDAFEHWNGTSWTGQGLPAGLATAAGNSASVSFITGTSASNITAVGTGRIDTGTTIVQESVAFHFNGTHGRR